MKKKPVCKKQTKPTTPKSAKVKAKAPARNPFTGANDVYLTKNKIAVTRVSSESKKRGHTLTKQTKYYEQNGANLHKLKAAKGGTVRIGRKGNSYKHI